MARKSTEASREVTQSYLITSARYNFSVYEKRILYRIVELIQAELKGKPLGKGIKIHPNLFDDKEITMPISSFFLREEENSYNRLRKAFKSLAERAVEQILETEKGKVVVGYPVIQHYRIPLFKGAVRFRITRELYDSLMNFAKGYSQYELQTAFSFRSQYTMRLYELTCKQKKEMIYSIEKLKKMFVLENRYKQGSDFVKKVIAPAQRELESSSSSYYFTYEAVKTSRSFTHIRFTTHYRTSDEKPPILPLSDGLEVRLRELLDFLNDALNEKDKTWVPHRELLLANLNLPKEGRPQNELTQILHGAKYANNPVGYVVNALKKRVAQGKR